MNPHDILDVADTLIMGLTEAEWRAAVSRAYYATFHVARQLFQQCGFQVPHADQAHAYLWLRLANAGPLDVRKAGLDLNDLRRNRNWADYDLQRPLFHTTAMGHVQAATDIIEILDAVAAEPGVCTQLTEAIKNYERDVLREITWRS
jgi:uncharacterized protein (UPF0332 family)